MYEIYDLPEYDGIQNSGFVIFKNFTEFLNFVART